MLLEGALGRERLLVAAALLLLTALAWLYLMLETAGAGLPLLWPQASPLLLAFLMWTVMMVAMMLPSAAPMVLLYARVARRGAGRGGAAPAVWAFVGGYLAIWTAFALLAALLQAALWESGFFAPGEMRIESVRLAGGVLLAAGVYQWLPLKEACLRHCRTPARFLAGHWREGSAGALRMGIAHGGFCLGCCWLLMLLLFAVGVMNLLWVAVVTLFVAGEKLLPAGVPLARIGGIALGAFGLYMLLGA